MQGNDAKNCGSCGHSCLGGACQAGVCQPVVLATGQNNPPDIAIDATNVYWVTYGGGTVMKCAIGGCNNTPTELASGQAGAQGIAVGATSVYWTADSVKSCTISGCGNAPTQLTPAGAGNIGVAVGANNVFSASNTGHAGCKCAIGG